MQGNLSFIDKGLHKIGAALIFVCLYIYMHIDICIYEACSKYKANFIFFNIYLLD